MRARPPCARGSTRSTRRRRPRGSRDGPAELDTRGPGPSESSRRSRAIPQADDPNRFTGCAWPALDEGDTHERSAQAPDLTPSVPYTTAALGGGSLLAAGGAPPAPGPRAGLSQGHEADHHRGRLVRARDEQDARRARRVPGEGHRHGRPGRAVRRRAAGGQGRRHRGQRPGRRHRGRPGLRRLPLRRQADRRDGPGGRDRQDVRRLVRRRPAGVRGEGPLEGAHDRPGARRLELPHGHVPRRRRREVPRHLRRAPRRRPEAPREGHADRHDARPRVGRRALDELPGALGVRRQGVRGRRQDRRPQLAADPQGGRVVHGDLQGHGSGGHRLARPGQQPGVPRRQGLGDGQRQHHLPGGPRRRAHRSRQEDADRQHGPRQLAGGAGRALRALQHQPVGGLRRPARTARASWRSCGPGTTGTSSRSGRRRGSPTSSRRSSASTRRTSGPTIPSSGSSAS